MKRLAVLLLAIAASGAVASPAAADFHDGTLFPDTATNGRFDLGPLYAFRSPANANNTVLILTVSPFSGVQTPTTFVKGARYDIAIDKTGDYAEDMTLRFTFGSPSAMDGSQAVLARCLPKVRCRRYVLGRGRTGQNLPVRGGGMLRAATVDIPDFFDETGWNNKAAMGIGAFPRPMGTAKNLYGPNANCLAIVIEIPSARIAPTNSVIAVWTRLVANGARQDREGRPFVNEGLIPKLPRDDPATERRDAFNTARPQNDVAGFETDMKSVVHGFYGRSDVDTAFLAQALLPDAMLFQIGNPGGFGTLVGPGAFGGPFAAGQELGNGRRLSDDVHDIVLNFVSNGGIPSDNVGDDNAGRITDGSANPGGGTRPIAFPYIGSPNSSPTGPNTG